jgi:sigma-B regulation protein RsbU (phosphoserine phosphatase)
MSSIKNDILNCGILIVEDDYLGRAVLKEIFKKQGFTRIEEAENGKECLGKIHSFKPGLVILDVVMPEMDGVECCKRIRADADPHIAHVPILFQTALDGIAEKARLFKAGATDYLTKPVDPHEITSRAIVHMEREVMTRRLREFNLRVNQELETARTTQRVLIPDDKAIAAMEKDYGLSIHGYYQSSSELGGDFWGFKSLSSEELAVYMVDFSGHGVNAALNVFRLHALMQAAIDTAKTPGAYLSHLNAILAPLLPTGQFATMFYGVINTKQNSFSYASAAAPPPILFTGGDKQIHMLENTGGLLGVSGKTSYRTLEIPFAHGDCLLLYSDALTETENENGKTFSVEEAAKIFQSSLKKQSNAGSEAIEPLLAHFSAGYAPRLNDDLTLSAYYRRA